MEAITINRYVQVICPVCKAKNTIRFPKSVINQASHLTTVSVPKGEICQHHFQLFIDKNFKIRGYQKVDFQLENDKKQKNLRHNYKDNFVNSLKLYESSESKENSIRNVPRKPDNKKEPKKSKRALIEKIIEHYKIFTKNFGNLSVITMKFFKNLLLKTKKEGLF